MLWFNFLWFYTFSFFYSCSRVRGAKSCCCLAVNHTKPPPSPSSCSLTPEPQCVQPASQTPCGNIHSLRRGQRLIITFFTSFLSFLSSFGFLLASELIFLDVSQHIKTHTGLEHANFWHILG